MAFDKKNFQHFPENPGVYLMKDRLTHVIYVGKAKNLRQRIRQYFVPGADSRPMIPFLLSQIKDIEVVVLTSEKEALLYENTLIKKHKPKYNALLKDDKSYIALKMTKHQWPRVDIVRYRGKLKADGTYFGPYTSAYSARQTLDLIHKIFPMRQCSDNEFARRTRPCILYDMKRCIAPCVGKCSEEQYKSLVERTKKFLLGQDKEIIHELYHEMEQYAEKLEFEKANSLLNTIRHIERTIEKQKVDRPIGNDVDVIGLFREADEVTLVLLLFRDGTLMGTKNFQFSRIAEDNRELLKTFLLQHYDTNEIPGEILAPEKMDDAALLSEILSDKRLRKVMIHFPKKGDKKALVKMATMNAETLFRKEKDATAIRERTLLAMQEKFRLSRYPSRIECFDISNLAGSEPVATMVAFTDGIKDKAKYRKYKVKTAGRSDDYGAMYEVLMRRYKRGEIEGDLPELTIVDGGKGHLNIALKVMKELNIINVDVIALAKEMGRHDRGQTGEKIFLPNLKEPYLLKRNSSILFFLQQIRDEAHRQAITFQRKRMTKSQFKSPLDTIFGIGPVKKKQLLRFFGSLKKLQQATLDEIRQVKGISEKDSKNIFSHLHQHSQFQKKRLTFK